MCAPPAVSVRPGSGTSPSSSRMKPFRERFSPSGRSKAKRSLISRISAAPRATISSVETRVTVSSSTSVSSTISPTSSSRTSSMVMSPSVPPNSSATIPMCR